MLQLTLLHLPSPNLSVLHLVTLPLVVLNLIAPNLAINVDVVLTQGMYSKSCECVSGSCDGGNKDKGEFLPEGSPAGTTLTPAGASRNTGAMFSSNLSSMTIP